MTSYLKVEVNDVAGMHVLDALADLAHDADAGALREKEVVADDAVKQLAAVHSIVQGQAARRDEYAKNKHLVDDHKLK